VKQREVHELAATTPRRLQARAIAPTAMAALFRTVDAR
jgi:hypothetical protein